MSEREIRSCLTEDGVPIAYSVSGDGPQLLICHEGLESFTLDHIVTGQEAFFDELGRERCVIRYDPRGIGLSQRGIDSYSIDAAISDMLAVLDAGGFQRVSIFAPCWGAIDALAFAARHPERVDRLIVYSALPSMPGNFQETGRAIAQLWRVSPRIASQAWADTIDRDVYPELCLQLGRIIGQSVNAEDGPARIEQTVGWDVVDLLRRIEAPTLVIHRRGDRSNPVATAHGIAARIRGARLAIIDGNAHWYAMDAEPILNAIAAFAPAGHLTAAVDHAPGGLRTILFTDVVGHTEMMQRLGDARGREVLREHERITRELLKQHGGAEVKAMGDGFMASFGSVTAAVECAIAIQRAFSAPNENGTPETQQLRVRVGLNAGEPIEEDGDLFGSTVILASRIPAKADGGEILVPDTVRGLLSGKGFMFADRGEFVPKGFEDAVRVYEVRWRSEAS